MNKDNINPDHYKAGAIECIVALDAAVVNKNGSEAFHTANVIKYLWRYEAKNGSEDIKKALWYLNRLLGIVEAREKSGELERLEKLEIQQAAVGPGLSKLDKGNYKDVGNYKYPEFGRQNLIDDRIGKSFALKDIYDNGIPSLGVFIAQEIRGGSIYLRKRDTDSPIMSVSLLDFKEHYVELTPEMESKTLEGTVDIYLHIKDITEGVNKDKLTKYVIKNSHEDDKILIKSTTASGYKRMLKTVFEREYAIWKKEDS